MKIVSYNVLANAYIKEDRYPRVPPQFLQWEYRSQALLSKIDSLNADLICLQEVEEETYQRIHHLLSGKGFSGVYARRKQGRPDGCATFSLLPIHQWEVVHYHDQVRGAPSGHLALITFIQVKDHLLAVANTHIKWDPPDTIAQHQIGWRQMQQLLFHHILPDSSVDGWVICGDMNCELEDHLLQEILRAGFKSPLQESAPTYYTEDKCAQIDFILCQNHLNITALSRPSYPLHTVLPNAQEPSDHLPIAAVVEFPSSPF
jgi:mRNA deadenylase 3'-5' endonuclease subunit Ccr4